MTVDPPPLDIELVLDAPPCPRCRRDGLLAVVVPRATAAVGGLRPVGTFQAVLCEMCGLDDPYAAALVVFFTVHGRVEEHTIEPFAGLLRRWIEHLHIPQITEDVIAADIEAWRDGQFD